MSSGYQPIKKVRTGVVIIGIVLLVIGLIFTIYFSRSTFSETVYLDPYRYDGDDLGYLWITISLDKDDKIDIYVSVASNNHAPVLYIFHAEDFDEEAFYAYNPPTYTYLPSNWGETIDITWTVPSDGKYDFLIFQLGNYGYVSDDPTEVTIRITYPSLLGLICCGPIALAGFILLIFGLVVKKTVSPPGVYPPMAMPPTPPPPEAYPPPVTGVTCPTCGTINPPGSAFCHACGKPLK